MASRDLSPSAGGPLPAANQTHEGRPLPFVCALGEPCHADVLLELANAPETPTPAGGVGLEPTSTTDAGRAPGTNQSPIQQTEPS